VSNDRPLILGVAGGSGAGKSTVVRRVIEQMPGISVRLLHHDSYYRDFPDLTVEERALINYDHPDSLETPLLVEHLQALIRGEAVEVPKYDFSCHRRKDNTRRVEPAPVVIVDGILVLADPELRELMDIRVYVETDPDMRFIRRLLRDTRERDRTVQSVVEQYRGSVRPMHLEFVEPSRRHAHVIVPFGGENEVAVRMLVARLTERLRED
jgi:uridine kinase